MPVKLDETELNEIPLTTGYLQGNSPVEVAITIAKKINSKLDVDLMLSELKYYLPNYEIDIIDSEVSFRCEQEDFYAEDYVDSTMKLISDNIFYETVKLNYIELVRSILR